MKDIPGFRAIRLEYCSRTEGMLLVTLLMILQDAFLVALPPLQSFHSLSQSPRRHTSVKVRLEQVYGWSRGEGTTGGMVGLE